MKLNTLLKGPVGNSKIPVKKVAAADIKIVGKSIPTLMVLGNRHVTQSMEQNLLCPF